MGGERRDPGGPRTPEIRLLSAADHAAIMDLWRVAGLRVRPEGRDSPEAFARQMAGGGLQTLLGLFLEGDLVGVALATHDGRKGWISRVAVHPDHRRRGHAARLVAEAERSLRARGLDVIGVLVESWNESSIRLFESTGYENAGGDIVYLSKRSREDA